jgi:hypothetical protein
VQTPADKALGSPDGYEILRSSNGSFTDDLEVFQLKDISASSWFDSTESAQTYHYRIRTTSGTKSNPYSVRGPDSGVVSHTSLDSSDMQSIPTTKFDQYTTSKTRATARFGNYGLDSAYQTPLGIAGGAGKAAGASSIAAKPTQTPAQTVTFDQIGTGENRSAQMIVGGKCSIDVDPDDPGVIDATELQGTPVSTTPPADQQIAKFNAATGQWEPTSIFALSINGVGVSTDMLIYINGIPFSVASPDQVNGVFVQKNNTLLQTFGLQINGVPI